MSDINFEKDQEEVLDKTENVDRLAAKIKDLQTLENEVSALEDRLKSTKRDLENIVWRCNSNYDG